MFVNYYLMINDKNLTVSVDANSKILHAIGCCKNPSVVRDGKGESSYKR